MWEFNTLFLLFFGALALSTIGVLAVLRHGRSVGIDAPDDIRKKHEAPISRLGGLPIFVSLCAGFLTLALRSPQFLDAWTPVILANAMVFSVGFLDDLRPLGARAKLLGQIGAALVLYAYGVSIDNLSNPLGEGSISLGWMSLPVTVFWLIAIPNIINLIDGMDGLAGGFGMFLCLTLAMIGHFSYMPDTVLVSTVMAGAIAGFLIFNFPPAKIFLGDGGAYLIGFFVASASLMSSNKGSVVASLLVIVIALGIPILDTAFAIVRRAVRGVPIFRADAEHIHHRLITLGYSKTQALTAMYVVCLILSLAGLSVMITKGLALPIIGAAVILLAVSSARYLGYVRNWKGFREQFRLALAKRRERQYIRVNGTLLEMELDRSTQEQFLTSLVATMDRLNLDEIVLPRDDSERVKITSASSPSLHDRLDHGHELQELHEALVPALTGAAEKWPDFPRTHRSTAASNSHD